MTNTAETGTAYGIAAARGEHGQVTPDGGSCREPAPGR